MGKTKKTSYDRYTLSFKLQAIRLADQPNITAIAVAESLGIHPVMLYRWRMENKNGTLRDGYPMKKKAPQSPKTTSPSNIKLEAELLKAQKRIKELEKTLSASQEELDILKKAKRFFSKAKK